VQKKMRLFRGALALCFGAWAVSGCGDDKDVETTDDTGGSMTTSSGTTTPDEPTTGDATTADNTTGVIGGGECDPKAQDCGEGQKCTAYGKVSGDEWNANKCVDVTGDGVAGDPCTVEPPDKFSGIDNCAEGFICLNTDDEGKDGSCVSFCSMDDACPNNPGGKGLCLPDTNEGFLPICLPNCDPLLQDCPSGQGCYGDLSLDFFICFIPDPMPGNGAENESCAFTNACLEGLSCEAGAVLDGCMEEACCTPFCPLDGDGSECTAPEECIAYFPEPVAGAENVGICVLPG